MNLELNNKTVLISGATGGIGTAICDEFLKEGAIIIPLYRNADKYQRLLDFLQQKGHDKSKIYGIKTELSSNEIVAASIKEINKKFGRIDVLVNNAGKSTECPFLLLEDDRWINEIDVNLNYTVRLTREVLKYMFIARTGSIVNVSSLNALRFGRGVVAYATAKAGINRLTQALAIEVGSKGVRVNAVCPGVIDTKMTVPLMQRVGKEVFAQTPIGRIGKPEEVAKAIIFLASNEAASFITGHILTIDGGLGL